MRQDLTDITIVLDRSGSMNLIKADTIGGFNTFLAGQQACPGAATISLVQFDNAYEVVYEKAPIAEAPPLTDKTFLPRGGTALLDAIGRTIDRTGARLKAMPEDQRPGKVVFVIQTDGEENSSREFNRDQVFERITRQRDQYQWQFVFLGANQDAIAEAAKLGIAGGSTMNFAPTSAGLRGAAGSTSSNVARYRMGTSATASYTDAEKKAADDLIAGIANKATTPNPLP